MSSASSVPTGLIGECILRDRTSIPGNKPFLRLNGPILRAPQATIKGREKQSGRRGRKTYALLLPRALLVCHRQPKARRRLEHTDVRQPYFRSQTAALPGDPMREAKGGTLLLRQVSQW